MQGSIWAITTAAPAWIPGEHYANNDDDADDDADEDDGDDHDDYEPLDLF